MHPLILFNANDPEDAARAEAAGNDILKLCVDAGGCLTGEHGVGIEKRDLMRHQYAAVDLDQQMAVRAAFDAQWLLNPSKVFPLEGTPHRMTPRSMNRSPKRLTARLVPGRSACPAQPFAIRGDWHDAALPLRSDRGRNALDAGPCRRSSPTIRPK